ncbi:3'(2'),5'-bisphosphate nucleotidase CysQ [Blochmannia endosymbiont of Colobopsis nipponica]|uniref:3'(2'),5'-bisphosphate nucleotidase CysQ n=1 Tax=Blochmannia endosymbiont of Colobopsis nipponica TaxID=2681987 RepID=UPI001782295A|nr:3'(2'),5'-bisphosphate nucleotidase CysQ [Blochmannia endosymbiont of Colobopsis nipponica]QOI10767.1 3'(2'),5'-bisphosphate nucleotidase CysQ [Blochmannia endosymbiont of Colobopsis nipponica]
MIEKIIRLSRKAGKAIMRFYNNKRFFFVDKKQDSSPVTSADLISHKIIICGLRRLTPDVPIVSEEDCFSFKKDSDFFWLVDPLDGTKEFLKRNNEFTVNIALVKNGIPVVGVIYAPAINCLYTAYNGQAWKDNGYNKHLIHVKNIFPPTIVVSRFHLNENDLQQYLLKFKKYRLIRVGSSLKFCMIAEGKAQFYPSFSSIKLWDTAAGYAVAMAAGAKIIDWHGSSLAYTLCDSFLNPGFEVSLY